MDIRRRNIVVSLDVGTSAVKAALGEVIYGQDISVLGIAQVPSIGLRKGNIIDIENTAKAIDHCLNELERLTGLEISSAVVGFSGTSVQVVNNHAVVAVGNPNYEITQEDKDRVLKSSQNIVLPPDKTIVQTIARQYIVDGYDGVKDPIGMVGSRLEVEVAVIIAAAAGLQNLHRSATRINLQIEQMVYNPLLVAESVLLPAEKEIGVALVDIGGGTTEIAIFEEGSLVFTSVLPVGGDYITKDLAIVLRTSIEEAARVKENHGFASPGMVSDEMNINVNNIQGGESKIVSQHMVADIINARVLEMAEMINVELEQSGFRERLPGGVVLTGGGAQLTGIVETLEEFIHLPVRLGIAENIKAVATDTIKPQNAVALGGLIHLARNYRAVESEQNQSLENVFSRLSFWLKDLFR
ncbi:MAG: cell division protein FtsA [Syntrophomonas sp.]